MSESVSRPTPLEQVKEFHEAFDLAVRTTPGFPDAAAELARLRFLTEEFVEYVNAILSGDLVKVADALADMQYIINGAAHIYGVDLDSAFAEVHRSSMSKLGAHGEVLRRGDGKIVKGPNYSAPSLNVPPVFRRSLFPASALMATLQLEGVSVELNGSDAE